MKEYLAKRLENFRKILDEQNADLFLINIGNEFLYLTDYDASSNYPIMRSWGDWIDCMIFGRDMGPVMVDREQDQLSSVMAADYPFEARFTMKMDHPYPESTLKEALEYFSPEGKTIAVLKKTFARTILDIQSCLPNTKVIALDDPIIDRARLVTDEESLKLMREAGKITSDILKELCPKLKYGMTVKDVAAELAWLALTKGGYEFSFTPGIVCVNPNSDPALRKSVDNVLKPGSTLSFDFGIIYHGYKTDFGRTLFVGEPREIALKPYRIITSIVQEITERMGDGKLTPADMYDYGANRAKETGYWDGFGYYQWGIGHSIGTDLHQWPWLRRPHKTANKPIREGMIFAVEPKINGDGQYYLRCEDDILVGKERGEVLTPFPYNPVVVCE